MNERVDLTENINSIKLTLSYLSKLYTDKKKLKLKF